jgi:hypothetical protein
MAHVTPQRTGRRSVRLVLSVVNHIVIRNYSGQMLRQAIKEFCKHLTARENVLDAIKPPGLAHG